MKNIIKSLVIVVAVAAVASVATWAYFSSSASVTNNTFATGTLEIRVNGAPTIAGFNVDKVAPGQGKSGQFDVNNYGSPWFAGPSNISAKKLLLSANNFGGDAALCDALTAEIKRCSGSCETAYATGALKSLTNANILVSWFPELIPGNSVRVQYDICLPDSGGDQNSLQGKVCTFDFV